MSDFAVGKVIQKCANYHLLYIGFKFFFIHLHYDEKDICCQQLEK